MLLADHFALSLAERAETDRALWVLDGDLADSDGAQHFARRHPDRFVASGIAEQNMVSLAAGLAAAGKKPFVFSFAAFLCCRAYDQIRVGLSQCEQPVVLVGSHAGGNSGRNGKTHTILNDLALMASLPHISIFAPGDAEEAASVARHLCNTSSPSYVRMPRRDVESERRLAGPTAPSRWLTPRREIALVGCGVSTQWALKTAELLSSAGCEVGVVHCLEPTRLDVLEDVLLGCRVAIVLEDHHPVGGLFSMLQARLVTSLRLHSLCWPASFSGASGTPHELLRGGRLTPSQLAHTVLQVIKRKD